ncbi:MAG: hypothetical protein HY332_17060 [Chloroflexi bacterium]|nr:hypothetical protein [Chloroflexota bacterium]
MDVWLILQLLSTLRRMRARERWSRVQIEAHQAEALRRLREHACARSPFYQQFHRGLEERPLEALPVLTKALLMEHFDELVTDRAVRLEEVRAHVAQARPERRFRDRYWVNTTSGSTGRPGIFLFDRAEWIAVLASFARAHEWAGLKISLTHRMKMASVASTNPWHMSAQVGAAHHRRAGAAVVAGAGGAAAWLLAARGQPLPPAPVSHVPDLAGGLQRGHEAHDG